MADAKPRSAHLLVVDDDADHLALVERWLALEGFSVTAVGSGEKALAVLESKRPDLVITDLVMSGIDGLRLLREIHRHDPVLPVIIVSGQAGIPEAVRATHLGASAFLTKPIQREGFIAEVEQVLADQVGKDAHEVRDFAPKIIRRSQVMAELLDRARLVARVDTTVLVTGETGTGKELLAEAIHAASGRCEAPFVAINCSALPEELLESELFGHEKGAFTGAMTRHEGLFQAANGGTLFLDEIGDMPLSLQAKLLRVLQDFKVRPVGSTKAIPVDVRIISATHHNLEQLVEHGDFREDLFYRLSVVPLHMPSLRERREDVAPLTTHFLERVAARTARPPKRFAPDALRQLLHAELPGNVRQLQNVVEQCSVLSPSDVISAAFTTQALHNRPSNIPTLDEAKQSFERRYLISVLRAAEGNVTTAARMAGRNRTEFYKLVGRYALDPAQFRRRKTSKKDDETDEETPPLMGQQME